ncbi:hypothetical protein L7F22_045912 [Adiantum nelumboides]|nr:hypothetical protein [Adiantum nelumboides]
MARAAELDASISAAALQNERQRNPRKLERTQSLPSHFCFHHFKINALLQGPPPRSGVASSSRAIDHRYCAAPIKRSIRCTPPYINLSGKPIFKSTSTTALSSSCCPNINKLAD